MASLAGFKLDLSFARSKVSIVAFNEKRVPSASFGCWGVVSISCWGRKVILDEGACTATGDCGQRMEVSI